ncbi:hypothetical protein GCM10027416_22460 [Okibacterium endophyticum]
MGHNEQEQAAESLRAVVYVRISDDPEGTERRVDRQETDCRAYAAAQGGKSSQCSVRMTLLRSTARDHAAGW